MADLVEYEVAREHLGNKITDDGIVQHQFQKGDTRLADPAIVKHLIGTVLIDPNASVVLRTDGPTVEEYVAAGYRADNYPPSGYASRSTDEEIADAQRAQNAADEEKAAATLSDKAEGNAASNKADKAPANKTK